MADGQWPMANGQVGSLLVFAMPPLFIANCPMPINHTQRANHAPYQLQIRDPYSFSPLYLIKMEIIRSAALIHFQNFSDDHSERNRIAQVFHAIDLDRNGAISEAELLHYLSRALPRLPAHKASWFFRQLDRDRNGYLDSNEFLTFYYAINYWSLCDSCMEVMGGLYYRCVICWESHIKGLHQINGSCHAFEVCCRCYWSRSYKHPHHKFVDNCVLFRNMESTTGRKESLMSEILESGRLYYRALPTEEKDIANRLFTDMDVNGDGRVSGLEAISFLIRKGASQNDASEAFRVMGITFECSLTLEDVVALWYAFVMRPCCKSCRKMIHGSYYTCVTCFQNRDNSDTWDVCLDCYRRGGICHEHTFFLDNYVMLQISGSRENLSTTQGASPTCATDQEIQVTSMYKIRQMLKLMARISAEAALSTAAGILCTIM